MPAMIIETENNKWEVICGLEIHCQIISESKMYSGASTEFGAEPNTHVSFVDAAMPGMLPTLNEQCVRQAVKTGLGLNAKINKYSEFSRKNYFYADLPQGYQITQFQHPIVGEGFVDVALEDGSVKKIGIERLHIEQDAGKSIHDLDPCMSFIDLNRAGVGLMEIVTKPDYVFDGQSCRPYKEDDLPSPRSVYGRTKLAGEQAVLECSSAAFVFRTSWLYSPFGNNFVKTMLRLGAEREMLKVVFDQVGTPTYAAHLAQAIVNALPHLKEGRKEVYHFSNEGVCSWFDFTVEIMARGGRNCKVLPIESKDYPTAAERPAFSVLNKEKFKTSFGAEIPHWTKGLEECLKQF